MTQSLTTNRQNLEDRGFYESPHAMLLCSCIFLLQVHRTAPVCLIWVKGHAGNNMNEKVDILANEGAQKTSEDQISLEEDLHLQLTGAKLSQMSQSLAYAIISSGKTNNTERRPCPQSQENIDMVILETAHLQAHIPPASAYPNRGGHLEGDVSQ
jgi:ribonuclease HI